MKLTDKQRDILAGFAIDFLTKHNLKDAATPNEIKKRKVHKHKVHRVTRRRMSVKARKAISIRMKKMWAEKNK